MSLPRPLLDLAWLRLNGAALLEKQHVPRAFANNSRFALAHRLVRRMHMQMHAPDASPMPDYGMYSAPGDMDLTDASFLRRRERPMRLMKPSAEHVELKSRLDELLNLPVLTPEEAATEDEQVYEPQITEEQLRAIYVDLLAPIKNDVASEEEKVKLLLEPEELLDIIESLEERLAILMEDTTRGEQNIDEGLAAKLLMLQSGAQPALDAPTEPAKADIDAPQNVEELATAAAHPEADSSMSAQEVSANDVLVQDSEVAALEDAVGTEEPEHLPSPQSASPVPKILVPSISNLDMNRPVHRVLARLDILLDRWRQDGVIVSVKGSDATTSPTPGTRSSANDADEITIMPIGLSVITLSDWNNILHSAIQAGDVVAGDVALQLMERARVPVDADLRAQVLKIHADIGNIDCVESFLARHCPEPTLEEIHLRIKAYAHGGKQSESCTILHKYEARGLVLPIKTYHSVIMCLLYGQGPGESQRRAQAWDMFAHMRYVAHTVPDRRMYNHMIKACSMGFVESDAERAMDIWTEMTMDHKIEPDIGSYNAIIRVCARNKNYLMESFRFARAMMDASRDAHGIPSMYPNYHTFVALLQASKRMGALSRARWLFAEILRVASHGTLVINDTIMQQVFHTYATYRPPYLRRQVKLMTAGENTGQDVPFSPSTEVVEDNDAPSSDSDPVAGPPGTAQVIAEADALFDRVTFEQNAGSGLLSQVEKTAQLGNAYLAVYSNHADFEALKEAYKRIFTEHGYPTDHTTLLALSFKARAISKTQPRTVLQFAWEIFEEWQRRYGDKAAELVKPKGDVLDARTTGWAAWRTMPRSVDVERFWGNMIDILAFAGQLDDAMALVRKFEYIYPPQNMREPLPTSPLRDMRTSLYADRPVVRFSSTTEVADDTVPPMLLFARLEVLHQRLTLKEREKDIRYVTWLTKAYAGSLQMRRDAAWGRKRIQKEKTLGVAATGNGFWPKPIMAPSRQASAPHSSSERRVVAGGRR